VTSAIGHPVRSEFLVQIGDMTVSFALLELQIQMLLEALIGEDQRLGQIIASQLSFARLRATVIGIYSERYGDDSNLHALRQLMKEAAEIEQERNRVTHSIWGVGTSSGTITRIRLTCRERSGVQAQFEEYDEAKFLNFNDRIKRLCNALLGFYTTLLQKAKTMNNAADENR